MRFRGLLSALGVLIALAALVWWSSKSKQGDTAKTAAETSPKLISVPEDQVTRIEIKRTSGETTVVERKGGQWEVTAPVPYRGDQEAINSLVSSAASLGTDQLVFEKAANLDEFGLARAAVDLTVTARDGKSHHALIGDETPTGSGYFAKLAGDARVFTIASYTKTGVDRTANDLRDKRLLTFDQDKLTRVEIAAKGTTLEFGRNNQNEWQIVKPRPFRADGGQVEELIRKLRDARLDPAVSADDAKKAVQAFGSAAPVAAARVTDASGTQELTVRRDKDKNCYAKSSVAEGVYKVGSDLGEALEKGLDGFRSKKLFDFGWTDPGKVGIRDGDKTWAWQKAGENWLAGAKKMDASTVQAVIDKLRDLSATKFPDQGFTTAAIDITVTSNEGKRVEKVALSNAGKSWFARREGEPSIYEVDGSAIDELRKTIGAVKEAPAEKKK